MFILRSMSFLSLAVIASFFLVAQAEAGKGGGSKGSSPTAVLNGPWAAEPGEVITFSGAGSSSPNGPIIQYCFKFGDGYPDPEFCSISQTTSHSYANQGSYTVTLTVTDSTYQTAATSDIATIEYAIPGQQADLTVTSIDGPRRGRQGDILPVTLTIENLDWATATGTALVGIYLSADNVITTDDYKRQTIYVTNLAGKQSKTYETTIQILGSIPPGDYYIGAIADETNVIDESDETNNTLSTTGTLTVLPQK